MAWLLPIVVFLTSVTPNCQGVKRKHGPVCNCTPQAGGGQARRVFAETTPPTSCATLPDVKYKNVEKRLKFCKKGLFVNLFLYQRRPVMWKINSVRKEYSNMIRIQTMGMLHCKLIINYNKLKINCFLFAMFTLIFWEAGRGKTGGGSSFRLVDLIKSQIGWLEHS